MSRDLGGVTLTESCEHILLEHKLQVHEHERKEQTETQYEVEQSRLGPACVYCSRLSVLGARLIQKSEASDSFDGVLLQDLYFLAQILGLLSVLESHMRCE
jgi:hypothetical protein